MPSDNTKLSGGGLANDRKYSRRRRSSNGRRKIKGGVTKKKLAHEAFPISRKYSGYKKGRVYWKPESLNPAWTNRLNPVNRGRDQRDRYIADANAKEATRKDVANMMLSLSSPRIHPPKKTIIGSRVSKKFPGFGKEVWKGEVTAGPDSKGRFRVYWPKDDSYTWHSRSSVEKIIISPRSSKKSTNPTRRKQKKKGSLPASSRYGNTALMIDYMEENPAMFNFPYAMDG